MQCTARLINDQWQRADWNEESAKYAEKCENYHQNKIIGRNADGENVFRGKYRKLVLLMSLRIVLHNAEQIFGSISMLKHFIFCQ